MTKVATPKELPVAPSNASSPEDGAEPAKREKPTTGGNPLRRTAMVVIAIAFLLFVLSIFMERLTPSTSQAVVQAYVVRMAPEVAGRIIEVGVVDNAIVAADQVLFRIDPEPYIIATREAEAGLARIGQTIGASTAAVDSAQARLVEVTANRNNIRDQAQRAVELVKRGVYARAKEDEAKASLQAADATVTRAEADLAKARQELGPAGENNPDLQAALAALERARLNLFRTAVSAPSAGVVTNLQLAVGETVSAGESAMTFIDAATIWIAAAFKENSLQFMSPGDQARIVLDSLPGQVFAAQVESVGWGVSGNSVDPVTGLPTIRNQSGWVREPQRFPVRLIFDGGHPVGVRYGSQANVVIYTGESNPVMNALGGLWIRIISVLTYVS
ncbi:HlyD family secretion protein [Skermanella pratensis]|uniref:HlyD family secretion protein n=1 Tax=Skermanella pratensis TaxID=2233999 RepID=UPI001B3B8D6C|nr:HlyD family secretion protein [Skermanella pratensis]